jgi:hypothetical protein
VTPASLGLFPPAGDERAAAKAWEDALATVDMEEEGGGIPAHSPRTGALLTDRQRRAYALAPGQPGVRIMLARALGRSCALRRAPKCEVRNRNAFLCVY